MNSNHLSNLCTPDYGPITGFLKHLNSKELQELLDSEEKMNAMISDLQQVKDVDAEKEMLFASNKSLSEFNFSKEPLMEDTRNQFMETHKIAMELKDSILEMKQKLEKNKSEKSLETLLALLQAATAEAEEKAEATVEAFLQNELSVDDFIKRYLEERKLAHLRRTKSEKMITLMQESGNLTRTPPTRPQRLRKPPAPPKPNGASPNENSASQNANYLQPSRQAPQPPAVNANDRFSYPGSIPSFPNQMRPPQPHGMFQNQTRPPYVPAGVRPFQNQTGSAGQTFPAIGIPPFPNQPGYPPPQYPPTSFATPYPQPSFMPQPAVRYR